MPDKGKKKAKAAKTSAASTANATDKDKAPKKKKNTKARLLVSAIIIVLLVGTVFAALNGHWFGQGGVIDSAWVTPREFQGKTINILVMGVDNDEARNEADEAWLTDVIMVVSFDMERGTASILQIPRDLYVGADTVYTGKINALYYYGIKGTETKGVEALASVIHDQFQLNLDAYVLITMEGFRRAVDMLGGIEITVTETMSFGEEMTLEPGTHVLNGVQADLFVRYREGYATQDIQRMEVQRYFMSALMAKLINTPTMDMVSVARAIYDELETDLSLNVMLELMGKVKNLTPESITLVRVPGEPVARYGQYGLDVFTVHKAELAAILNQYMRPYGDPVPETDLRVIEIQKTVTWYDDTEGNLGEYGATAEDAA